MFPEVIEIGGEAFSMNSTLETFIAPQCKILNDGAFEHCNNLKIVVM